jgi:hypothetical protein
MTDERSKEVPMLSKRVYANRNAAPALHLAATPIYNFLIATSRYLNPMKLIQSNRS